MIQTITNTTGKVLKQKDLSDFLVVGNYTYLGKSGSDKDMQYQGTAHKFFEFEGFYKENDKIFLIEDGIFYQ